MEGSTCCFTGRGAASYHLVWMFQHLCRQLSGPVWCHSQLIMFTITDGEVGDKDHVLQMRKLRCVGRWSVTSVRSQGEQGVQALYEMGALFLVEALPSHQVLQGSS